MKDIKTLLCMSRQARYFNHPLRQFLVRRAWTIRDARRPKKVVDPEAVPCV